MTDIWGISISGYWSTARFISEKSPKTITPTNMSTVETGFRTALSYIFICFGAFYSCLISTLAPS